MGNKDVLGMWIGEHETPKFWLVVLNELKNRGVKDILIISVDNLNDFSEAIGACFPEAGIQCSREIKGVKTIEKRYHLCSISQDAKQYATAVRGHWGIENSLHWVLDVVFKEDGSRIRKDHAPENMALVRHVIFNLLKHDKETKLSMKRKN